VVLAANGQRISQLRGNLLGSLRETLRPVAPFEKSLAIAAAVLQSGHQKDSAGPRAKVFRREVIARYLGKVRIDVRRPNAMYVAVIPEIFKQFLAWQVLTALDNPRESAVRDAYGKLLAALSSKMKSQ